MKTKNFYGWLAMAVMLVGTGCSTDEVVNDFSPKNAIQFGTYVGRDAESRATVINDTKLGTDGFGVFAYYTAGNEFSESATPNFMYNQLVKKNDEGKWAYSPLKYWPNNEGDKVSFFAYAPYTAQPATGDGDTDYNIGKHYLNTSQSLPSLTFYVHPTVKDQVDLLWATPVLNQTKQTVADDVKFNFHHALARIGFSVQAMIDIVNEDNQNGTDDDATDASGSFENQNGTQVTTVSVQSIKLSGNFYNVGTLSYASDNNDNYTASFQPNSFTAPAGGITYTLSGTGESGNFENVASNVTIAEQKLNKDDSYIMIIPRGFTSTNNQKLNLEIVYKVTTTDPNLDGGKSEITNTITKEFFIQSGFEAGKAYNFSLHLGLTSVKLSATVGAWVPAGEEETDYVVNVPINTTNP